MGAVLMLVGVTVTLLVLLGAGTLMARLLSDLSEIGDVWRWPGRQRSPQ